MKGRDTLIAMRRKGVVPPAVVLLLSDDLSEVPPGWLAVDPAARLDREDLRCVVGLKVFVHGPYMEPEAVTAACKAVMAAKATGVLGFATDRAAMDAEALVYADGDC